MTPPATLGEKACAAVIAAATLFIVIGTLRVGFPRWIDAALFLVSIGAAAWAVDLWHKRQDEIAQRESPPDDDGYGTGGYP